MGLSLQSHKSEGTRASGKDHLSHAAGEALRAQVIQVSHAGV